MTNRQAFPSRPTATRPGYAFGTGLNVQADIMPSQLQSLADLDACHYVNEQADKAYALRPTLCTCSEEDLGNAVLDLRYMCLCYL